MKHSTTLFLCITICLLLIASTIQPVNARINANGNVVDTFNNVVDIFGFSKTRMELYCAHPALIDDLDNVAMGTNVTELIRLNVLKPCFVSTDINLDLNLSNLFTNLVNFDTLIDSGEQIGCQYQCPIGQTDAIPIGWGRTHVCLESTVDSTTKKRSYKVGCSLFGTALQFLRKLTTLLQQRVSEATAAICPPAQCQDPKIYCVASKYQQFHSTTSLVHTYANFGLTSLLSPDSWGLQFLPQFNCNGEYDCADPDGIYCVNGTPMIGSGHSCAREASYTGPLLGFEWSLGYSVVDNSACSGIKGPRAYNEVCQNGPLKPQCTTPTNPTTPTTPTTPNPSTDCDNNDDCCKGSDCGGGCGRGGCSSKKSQNVEIYDINTTGISSIIVNGHPTGTFIGAQADTGAIGTGTVTTTAGNGSTGVSGSSSSSGSSSGSPLQQLKDQIQNLVEPLVPFQGDL